ncbi:MAG TPA: DUF6806 family protein [Burkholderiales bacterium]|jgi:hypothetical protein|nr:DUF6806 family protein [Burkholderiales bacterium]
MRVEVHVHGTVLLKAGTSTAQIEAALRPWLDYIDEDSLGDAKSVHPDEPGIVFDRRRRVLDVCWTGDVGRSFRQILGDALEALNAYSEEAASFDITYYHADGRDEFDVMFVGPTAEAIHEARRRRMFEDLRHLLGREFSEAETGQVLALVDQLFERHWQSAEDESQQQSSDEQAAPIGRKQLH